MSADLRRGLSWRFVAAAASLLVSIGVGCAPTISDEVLVQKTTAAQPSWRDYDEDLKAQVGVAPLAEWKGALIEAQLSDTTFRATFRLTGPWRTRAASIPILMRDPGGATRRSTRAERADDTTVYSFELSDPGSIQALPWVELRYPGGERRIALSGTGQWREGA